MLIFINVQSLIQIVNFPIRFPTKSNNTLLYLITSSPRGKNTSLPPRNTVLLVSGKKYKGETVRLLDKNAGTP